MGKYKQWLHHQEIGRRLRDQINTLEQERARVQKMAPPHPTTPPQLENPLIAALLNYTRQGNKLSNIDVIKAAMPKLDPDQRQPAGSAATPAAKPSAAPASIKAAPIVVKAPAADSPVVASQLAQTEQMPSDPLDQMHALSQAQEGRSEEESAKPLSAPSETPRADSVGGWWQRQRAGDDE